MRARGLVIQVIIVVLHLGVEVTWAKIITLSRADLFMLLYMHVRLVTLGIALRVQYILHRVHHLDLKLV